MTADPRQRQEANGAAHHHLDAEAVSNPARAFTLPHPLDTRERGALPASTTTLILPLRHIEDTAMPPTPDSFETALLYLAAVATPPLINLLRDYLDRREKRRLKQP